MACIYIALACTGNVLCVECVCMSTLSLHAHPHNLAGYGVDNARISETIRGYMLRSCLETAKQALCSYTSVCRPLSRTMVLALSITQ